MVNIEKLKKIELEKEKKLAESGIKHPKLKINSKSIVDWALDHYDSAEDAGQSMRWNGRQIRNAFEIASSLARYDTAKIALEGERMMSPTLGARQFKLVAKTIEKFDTYMQHATGMADSDHARIEGTRADEIKFGEERPSNRSFGAATAQKSYAQRHLQGALKVQPKEKVRAESGAIRIRSNEGPGRNERRNQRNNMEAYENRSFETGGEEFEAEASVMMIVMMRAMKVLRLMSRRGATGTK
ncbi:hypothetical protein V8C35DRAFT_45524 [Trichoderma chlorosporum]